MEVKPPGIVPIFQYHSGHCKDEAICGSHRHVERLLHQLEQDSEQEFLSKQSLVIEFRIGDWREMVRIQPHSLIAQFGVWILFIIFVSASA